MFQGREKRSRRRRLSRLLAQFRPRSGSGAAEPRVATDRGEKLRLEALERRQLLAGDLLDQAGPAPAPAPDADSVAPLVAQASSSSLTVQGQAEGEPAPDLVQFARDLDAAGVIYYGAAWCPACTEQKQLFGDGGDELPFVEVTNPDRSIGQIGIDNNITAYPTWVFPDQSRETGVLTLQQLSDRSGVPIPQSETPSFEPIGDQTALIGSPFHIPVDAYDPDGGPLTVTVSVADPSLLEASVITGNRSIRIDMETYDDMVFELFEQRAPRASGRVIELAQSNFYDDILFHRVVDDFVIQGGDPTGTGTGGSSLGDFDDDFHPELQHNRSGVLSFAKSSDDTNDSQFFITEVPTRFLDFNHSVFGQLVEGADVRESISEHAVNNADRPTTDIAINTIEVFTDTENSVVMLKPTGSGVGSTNVTVTVTDQDGNASSETFQVDVNTDTANSQPFLNEVSVPETFTPGTPASLQLSSTDIEGDPVSYSAQVISTGTGATASIDQNGLLTVTPASGFTGAVDVQTTVRPGSGVTGNGANDSDNQVLTFNFEGEQAVAAPASIDLDAASDSGASDSDNITNAGSLAFTVDGVTDGATVELVNVQTSAVLGQAVASGNSVTITTNNIAALGDGEYQVAARQSLGGETSELSGAVAVTYDTTRPAAVASSANTRANVGRPYQTDLINGEEGSIVYELTQFPVGATINSGSGLIEWTPDASDEGSEVFTVRTTDLAGNSRTENFTVTVSGEPQAEVKLVVRDLQGNEVDTLSVGDDFVLELVGVDARDSFDQDGVFAIYADILFDSNVVQPISGSSIEYVGNFTLSPKGSFADGLIDELGAASTSTVATNEAESVIARVEMEAVATGTVNIRSEEADESSSEVLLYGVDNQIPPSAVFFGGVNLTVGVDFTLADDSVTVDEDSGATVIDVLANDTSNATDGLSVVSVTQPQSGGSVAVDNGQVTFTPADDFNGTATFTYRAGDGSGVQDDATVTVTVTPVNDPPTGNGDTFNVVEGSGANRLEVLANDSSDPDSGETLSVTEVVSSTDGVTIEISDDGTAVNYTPASGFTGTDTFTYTVSDGELSDNVTVTVTVAPADDPPTAVDDSFDLDEDAAETSYDVLANDTRDADDEPFVIDSVGTPSAGGSVRFSSDGATFFYAPAADFFGTETVTYTIRDSGGGLSAGTVTFNVAAVNDPPPVLDSTIDLNAGEGQTEIFSLADLPENVDGDSETLTLSVSDSTTPSGGAVEVDAEGAVLYTPPSETFSGTDTVSYTVSDGSGTVSTGTLTLQVNDFTERSISVGFSGKQALSLAAGVRLTGTDALGNPVSLTPQLDADDNLVFEDLLPGEYVVEIPAVPFFTGGDQPQRFEIDSAPDEGDAMVQSSMGRIKPQYLSMQDWLGSSPRQSALVVVEPGQSAILTQPTAASADVISNPVVALNEAGTQLTVSGQKDLDPSQNNGDEDVEAAVLTNQSEIVQPRGQIGRLRMYKLDLAEDALSYDESTGGSSSTGPSASGGGEGEAVTTGVTETLVGGAGFGEGLSAVGAGEGEAVAAAASTIANVHAPLRAVDPLANDRSDHREEETQEAEQAPVDLSQSLASRRRAFASGSAPQPGASSATESTRSDEDSADESPASRESSLNASQVDRFFRWRR